LKSTSFSHLEEYIKAIHKGQLCVSDPLARILFQDLIETENHKVLTPREKDVLDFLCKGFSNREIASMLKLSIFTVKNHASSIMKKMNVSRRYQLISKMQTN
jgi:DNA-binding NarL/FixJ family response regulator